MCATDMRAPRFVSGLAGTGGVDEIEAHEYSRGVTDGGGEGDAKSGVACAGGVDGRAGVEGTEVRERVTGTCTGSGEGVRESSGGKSR